MMAKKGSDEIHLSVGIAIINVELIFIVKIELPFLLIFNFSILKMRLNGYFIFKTLVSYR